MAKQYTKLSRQELLDKINDFERELKIYIDRVDERYKVFFERNLAGIYRSKISGKIVECNEALAEILGYASKEELIGSDARMLYMDIRDREEHLRLIHEKKFVRNRKLALVKKDGSPIWVAISTTEITNRDNGEVEYLEGTIIDITELINTQELLRKSEQNYKAMLDQSPYGIIIHNGGRIVYHNERSELILMLKLDTGKSLAGIFPKKLINQKFKAGDINKMRHFDRIKINEKRRKIFLDVYVKQILFENYLMIELSFVDIRDRIKLEEERIKTEVFRKLNDQLKGEILEKEKIEKDLKASLELNTKQAAKLESIFENRSHVIWTIDSKYRLTSFNRNFSELFNQMYGVTPKLLDKVFTEYPEVLPKEKDKWKQAFEPVFKGTVKFITDSFQIDGHAIFTEIFLNPIYNSRKKVVEISGIGHDITEKMMAESKLTESLKEKDILLKEIHHRVKNNLQVISSIFNLQTAFNKEDKIREVLKESQNRIKSMAYIHESLYKSSEFGVINFEEYIKRLTKNLIQSYSIGDREISLLTETEKVLLNLDQAIPCGLIVNEIVSNSLKHAFNGSSPGIIAIYLSSKGGRVRLKLVDNGVGISERELTGESNTLGFQLIHTLVEQIHGDIEVSGKSGTSIQISFTLQE